MERALCYDVTRLLTRVLNKTPNGIDRVDFSLARSFLAADGPRFGAVSTGWGSRLMGGQAALEAVEGIAAHWGERADRAPGVRQDEGPEQGDDPIYRDVIYRDVVARITGAALAPAVRRKRGRSTLRGDVANGLAWVGRHGIPVFATPAKALPKGSAYVNASQFPLWVAGAFTWLEERRDVKAAFFIHDLLPITMPEYFREAEFARHRARLETLARFGSAALVTTRTVANDLAAHLATLGRTDLPIFTAPTPVAPIFSRPRRVDPALAGHAFFVLCSTIEPRKNHLMILATWRDLVRRRGAAAPKLVLVGTLGWKYELIVDLLARSPPLRDHVVAVSGLSTPGLKRLMDNARAVLMPSFAEGYGLPVHEALAAGAPVLASDIPAFREIGSPGLTLLSPLDGEAWLETVERLAGTDRGDRPCGPREPDLSEHDYVARLDAFVAAL